MNKKLIGVFSVLIASIMWSIEPIFAKLSYQNSDFIQTSAIRAIFAAITAFVYIIITRKNNLKINKKEFSIILYISFIGTLFADFMYFYALTSIPVINAVLIGHMQPIFIILIGFIFLSSDTLSKYDYFGILLMILAGLLVTTMTLENLFELKLGTIGDLMVLSATIAWASTAIAMRRYLKETNTGLLTFYRFFFASIIFLIYLFLKSSILIHNVYQIFLGIIVGIGTILYYEGLKRIKAAQVSGLELSTPFFAAILGFFILNEKLTIMQIIGIVLLFFGIYFISKRED